MRKGFIKKSDDKPKGIFKRNIRKIVAAIEEIIDEINWNIAMFLKHGPDANGFFASVIVPFIVAFLTALFVIVKTHK